MKKIILGLAVLAAVGFTSCNKEKDCICTVTAMGMSIDSEPFTIDEGECSDGDMETTTSGITTTTKCTEQ